MSQSTAWRGMPRTVVGRVAFWTIVGGVALNVLLNVVGLATGTLAGGGNAPQAFMVVAGAVTLVGIAASTLGGITGLVAVFGLKDKSSVLLVISLFVLASMLVAILARFVIPG